MLCEYCNIKPATVILKQIIDGETKSVHICKDCAAALGVTFEENDDNAGQMDNFFSDLFKKKPAHEDESVCSCCGMTLEELKKNGKVGCQDCYTAFTGEIESVLSHVHSATEHCGKTPNQDTAAVREVSPQRQIEELKAKLATAIQNEEYELAAKYRDEIKALSEKGE